MRKLFITLLAAFALPTVVNAELTNDYFLKFTKANSLLNKGDFSKAEKICDEMIEISPEKKWGYFCKASTLIISGKKKREAFKNLTRAIEIDPLFYDAYFMRGFLQFSMRRKSMSKIDRTACSDIKKAFLNDNQYAIDYVNKNKTFLTRDKCIGFY
jgi:tetratricopeptide (TPR) repeat protein